ncbi:P-loop containing nucleoside triphosphate hydrolase [Pseudocohnilembus persalinus]|uniref:p-loop containing nucleoside triphosphate hydrolase n=1 Tax=Pseudocohnilembus persalinus TaxID=266149 RepID=A0A0V0QT12_PSEPJ|nr:P-loop containing nucleoside triphosphate hydrolase [Pseudocohnilembus persalinus]|eukprot:KRX05422.1 P-loop containing nucleoside triphosphate hydrolase [Pseudocohnilembus persalinus]
MQNQKPLYKEESIPFITFEQDNTQYNVNPEACEFIKSIPQPIGVISVAGLYRTGKSYLLNRMLLNRSNGFGVGPTVQACTKGLWIWGTPIKGYNSEGEPINILIIDSEGIGALDEDQTHDSKIFSLAILLSSQFIYNSVGSIDENAIQNLSLVVNLTKHIQIKSNGSEECDSEEYSQHFPSFFWVIRDFSLQLCDQEGEPITAKEYLEKSLQEQRGFSDEIESKNRIRRLLNSFFKERECITLVRPLVNEDNLQKLDQMELDQLRPEFFEQVMGFRKRILTHCKPKQVNGKNLNGEMYMALVNNYITSINEGAVPNIENAWSYVCKDECYKATQSALEIYEKTLKEILYPKLPTTLDEVKFCHKQAKEQAVEIFRKMAVGDVAEEFQREVLKKIKEKSQQLKFMNEKESKNCAQNFIAREFQSIERKLKMGEYKDYKEYEKDIRLFYQFLLEHGPKIVNRQVIYLDFLQKVLNEGANIFLKNLQGDFEVQKVCSEEMIQKKEQEIKEIKESLGQQIAQFEQQIHVYEKEKSELLGNEKRNEESLKELQEQYEKMETELKQEMLKERGEFNSNNEKLKSKVNELEDELQEVQRELLMKESAFNKEKALLEHKASHFESLLEEQTRKEQQFDNNMNNAKSQLNVELKEMQEKYEQQLKFEKNQLAALNEKMAEMQEQRDASEKNLENEIEVLQEKNKNLSETLEQMQLELTQQKEELDNLLDGKLKQSEGVQEQISQEMEQMKQQKDSLLKQVTDLSEKLKAQDQDYKKQEALLIQKNEFLSAELEDTKEKLEDQRQAHQSTLNALEMSNLEQQRDYQNKEESKKFLEIKESHMKEMAQLEQQNQVQTKQLQEQIEQLQKELAEVELEGKVSKNNFEDEVKSLRENLESVEKQRDEIYEKLKQYEDANILTSKQMESKQQETIRNLEQQIEEMSDKMQRENQEMQVKSEEALAQLKNFYEIEKERLETRLQEEREKREKGQEGILEEYEERLREQASNYEEEIDMLKEDLRELEVQTQTMTGQYEHELDLKIKNIENLEKIVAEGKEQLQQAQKNYAQQIEQQQANYNSEKMGWTEKNESLSSELQRKEKELIKLQQKKEGLENTLKRKEELFETTKNDLIGEKNQLNEKLEETKKNLSKVQDDFLQHKINYEKSIALSTQQNEFFGKKVEELEKQLEISSQRYEERIKSQKSEWQSELGEKLGRIQEEKQQLEAKYDALKKNNKEGEMSQGKKISALEKEKAIIQEKLSHTTQKLQDLEQKSEENIQNLTKQLNILKSQQDGEKSVYGQELEALKKQISSLEAEKHELQSGLERDQLLWEGKFQFLQQQKDQAKNDLAEVRKNFELTLQKLKEARSNDQSDHQANVQDMLNQIEKKYQSQIQSMTERNSQEQNELNGKIKKLEKELKTYEDKNLLDSHSKNTSEILTQKKIQEMFDNEKKMQQQVEKIKQQKEEQYNELMKKLDKEKDSYKQKISELEEKYREGERKRSTLIFEHEKERAKWNLEKDHLLCQRNDLQEQLNRIEKKRELLLRENERLKNDNRYSKRAPSSNIGTSFNLNVSRNMGSDRKSPISNRNQNMSILGQNYGQNRGSYNNYSMINNSFQQENDNDISTNKENNILSQLDSSRDKENYQGFKSFQQKMTTDSQKQGQVSQQQQQQQQSVVAEALSEKQQN